MKALSWIFFFGYAGSLLVFGGLGTFTAHIDHRLLFHINPSGLPQLAAASILSQYRFLRAIECGFGLFALCFRREIFTQTLLNRVFLGTMFFGVTARFISLVWDGPPYPIFYFFFGSELIGGIVILLYTRKVFFGS
jgi:hypothetical protein